MCIAKCTANECCWKNVYNFRTAWGIWKKFKKVIGRIQLNNSTKSQGRKVVGGEGSLLKEWTIKWTMFLESIRKFLNLWKFFYKLKILNKLIQNCILIKIFLWQLNWIYEYISIKIFLSQFEKRKKSVVTLNIQFVAKPSTVRMYYYSNFKCLCMFLVFLFFFFKFLILF